MSRKQNSIIVISFLTFSTLLSPVALAAEKTLCPIGQQQTQWITQEDGTRTAPTVPCEPATWGLEEFNDGFDSSLNLYMYPSPSPIISNMAGEDAVAIMCSKKKLSVYFIYPYASSTGWNGTGRILFDAGKPITYKYAVTKSFQSLALSSPSEFMKNLVKAKVSFTTKFTLVTGSQVFTYAKGDIMSYRAKFAKAGCKF